jgi:hypothetical protein
MDKRSLLDLLAWIGIGCWGICFWWMHRISSKQNSMLKELHDVTRRIEDISRAEHELIREVHPQVGEIKEAVADVADAVSSESPAKPRS